MAFAGSPSRPALVVNHLKGGGKEQCVVNLANALFEAGARPMVVCFETGDLAHRIRYPGVPVFELRKRHGNDPLLPFRLARLLRDEGATVVNSNNWGTLVESLVAGWIAGGVPVVHTQHGLDYELGHASGTTGSPARRLVKRLAGRWLAHTIAVSQEVRDMLLRDWKLAETRVDVVHNGIEMPLRMIDARDRHARRAAFGIGPRDVLVGSVAYLRPVKDYPTLLSSMAGVVREAPHVKLLIVGSGPSLKELRHQVERDGLTSHVQLLGARHDVPDLLPLLDIFALASVSEGISIAILEAMATGVPVVATHVGGNPEVVADGKTGLLVPPRDSARLTLALLELVHDPARRVAMGSAALERARTSFSLDQMAREYASRFDAVARRTRRAIPRPAR